MDGFQSLSHWGMWPADHQVIECMADFLFSELHAKPAIKHGRRWRECEAMAKRCALLYLNRSTEPTIRLEA